MLGIEQQYVDRLHWRRTLVQYNFTVLFLPHMAEKVQVSDTTMLSIVEKACSNIFFLHYQLAHCSFPHCIKITDLLLII